MTEWAKNSFIRRPSYDDSVVDNYCGLAPGQPLLLVREPDNPKDSNCVLVRDLHGAPVGAIAREHAAEVAAKIDAGWLVLCKTVGPCTCIYRKVYLWIEGRATEEEDKRYEKLPKTRTVKPRVTERA